MVAWPPLLDHLLFVHRLLANQPTLFNLIENKTYIQSLSRWTPRRPVSWAYSVSACTLRRTMFGRYSPSSDQSTECNWYTTRKQVVRVASVSSTTRTRRTLAPPKISAQAWKLTDNGSAWTFRWRPGRIHPRLAFTWASQRVAMILTARREIETILVHIVVAVDDRLRHSTATDAAGTAPSLSHRECVRICFITDHCLPNAPSQWMTLY